VISVKQLTKFYGSVPAVDNISFDVARGSIVGFLGPNGAGKSTTLKMLTCYLPPTSGTATVNGFDIFHQSQQVREHLGYLPENTPLYLEMKVEEYLDFRERLRGMDREARKKRIDYVVERCWLQAVRRRVRGHWSRGYRKRVGFGSMAHSSCWWHSESAFRSNWLSHSRRDRQMPNPKIRSKSSSQCAAMS
jgi:ABC-2 type transport system ATP-binding protein